MHFKSFILIFLIATALIRASCCYCYGVTENQQGKRLTADVISGMIDDNKKLQGTIKGAIFWMSRGKFITAGPPNMFGSTVKLGIPQPTGGFEIDSYTPPAKGHMYYFANKLHEKVEALSTKALVLPQNPLGTGQIALSLLNIQKNVDDLQTHDQAIQKLIGSPSYDSTKTSLAIGKEIIAMKKEAEELDSSLTVGKDKIHSEPTWTMAGKHDNWK
jgi:hypothetical protein